MRKSSGFLETLCEKYLWISVKMSSEISIRVFHIVPAMWKCMGCIKLKWYLISVTNRSHVSVCRKPAGAEIEYHHPLGSTVPESFCYQMPTCGSKMLRIDRDYVHQTYLLLNFSSIRYLRPSISRQIQSPRSLQILTLNNYIAFCIRGNKTIYYYNKIHVTK